MIFVDEMGINTNMARAYGRAPKGERVVEDKPMNTPPNTTVLGALGAEGLVACMCVEGPADGETFNLFIEQLLAPALKPGQVVLMDNVNTHKFSRVTKAIEGAEARSVFLPTCSPDYNPLEECWPKIETVLRTEAAQTQATLMAGLKEANVTVPKQGVLGWFIHAGYSFKCNSNPL